MESQRLKEKGQRCCESSLGTAGVPWVLKDMACSRLELGGEATFQNLPVPLATRAKRAPKQSICFDFVVNRKLKFPGPFRFSVFVFMLATAKPPFSAGSRKTRLGQFHPWFCFFKTCSSVYCTRPPPSGISCQAWEAKSWRTLL